MGRSSGVQSEELVPDGEVPTTEAILEKGMRRLENQISTLQGVALVRALALLKQQLKQENEEPPDDPEAEANVFELLSTGGLLPERRRELIAAERAFHVAAIARLDALEDSSE